MADCAPEMPLSSDQLRLLMAEIAELQRIGYGEIRIVVYDGRVNIAAVTRSVLLTSTAQVQKRLEELEKPID